MGFPDPGCRRHPNQKQLPGVCSFCLRERLSKLSSGGYSYKTAGTAFSDVPSLSFSPPEKYQGHRRNGSDVAAPLGFVLHQGSSNGRREVNVSSLKKSRSVAYNPRTYDGGEEEKEKDGKSGKKGGGGFWFWKKLIHSTSKKTKGVLMHSTTVKDRSRFHDQNNSSSFRKN